LLSHHGNSVNPPQRPEWKPAPAHLVWHGREVFKGKARYTASDRPPALRTRAPGRCQAGRACLAVRTPPAVFLCHREPVTGTSGRGRGRRPGRPGRNAAASSIKSHGGGLPALVIRRMQHAYRARNRATRRRPPAGAARPCRMLSTTTASEGSPTLTAVKVSEAALTGILVTDRARLRSEVPGRRCERRGGRQTGSDSHVSKPENGVTPRRPLTWTEWPTAPALRCLRAGPATGANMTQYRIQGPSRRRLGPALVGTRWLLSPREPYEPGQ
jgi:hypothetical protein